MKMSNWFYCPMLGRVRTRVHLRTGEIQQQTVDSGVHGWRLVPPRATLGAEARLALPSLSDPLEHVSRRWNTARTHALSFLRAADGHLLVCVVSQAGGDIERVSVLHRDNCDAGPLARLVARNAGLFPGVAPAKLLDAIIDSYAAPLLGARHIPEVLGAGRGI